jgi:CheY-like chemotaxis protein
VVEDDTELLEIVVTMIQDLGYKVLVAANGVEAIALLNGDTPIDLLFSDVVMPHGINGPDLASDARGARLTEMHALADFRRLRRYRAGGISTPTTSVIAAPLTHAAFLEAKKLASTIKVIAFNAARWIERSWSRLPAPRNFRFHHRGGRRSLLRCGGGCRARSYPCTRGVGYCRRVGFSVARNAFLVDILSRDRVPVFIDALLRR